MYKLSKYNIVYPLSDTEYLIVNCLYQSKCKIHSSIPWVDLEKQLIHMDKRTLSPLLEKQMLVPLERNEEKLNEYLLLKRLFSSNSLAMKVVLGYQCNFTCAYCWQDHNADDDLLETSKEKILPILNTMLRKRTALSIEWIGGEPLLYLSTINQMSNRFIEVCDRRGCRYSASIVTNGYLLTPEVQQTMIHKNKIHTFMITLDGNKCTHDSFRILSNGKGTFDIITANLISLLRNKPKYVNVVIRLNVSPQILGHEREVADTLLKFPISNQVHFLFIPTNAVEQDKTMISFQEYIDFCLKMKDEGVVFQPVFQPKFMMGVCSMACDNTFVYSSVGLIRKCQQSKNVISIEPTFQYSEYNILSSQFLSNDYNINKVKCVDCRWLPMCQGLCCPERKDYCIKELVSIPRYGQLLDEPSIPMIHLQA